MTKHDDDISRDPLDCLDLRNAPDGKGPLAKYGTPDKFFVVDTVTSERASVREDPDGTYIASTKEGGDVAIQQNPDDQKWYAVDAETGEIQRGPDGEPTGDPMEAEVVKGQPGGRGDPKLVKQLQMFLVTLGFDLGETGPAKDGVDGSFGEKTDKAVKDFQSQHTDFNGDQLKQDGKVGPKTSDALNRSLVGVSNDDGIEIDAYLTPPKLTKDSKILLLTSTREAIKQHPVVFDDFGKVVAPNFDKLTIVLVD